jgi:tRNA-specific 2-thiouridylase
MTRPSSTVAVAISGGVDSSVAAALLLQAGQRVLGVTLRLFSNDDLQGPGACCGMDGLARAEDAARHLGIPHRVLDCHREFEERVLRPCWEEYARGRTPNPCVWCNRRVKFELLLEEARRVGVSSLATGHYARLQAGPDGRPQLLRGRDTGKDQSYFLYAIPGEQLAGLTFPVGELTKPEVRELATAFGLPNADQLESQDACFLDGETTFAETLRRRFLADPPAGEIVDTTGRVIGRHQGVHRFTIGQRHGLKVALGQPAWVKAIDANLARVTVTTETADLLAGSVAVGDLLWQQEPPPSRPLSVLVQIRYRHPPAAATLEVRPNRTARVRFQEPQRAVTPGQAAVFYAGDRVLGGGTILSAGSPLQ